MVFIFGRVFHYVVIFGFILMPRCEQEGHCNSERQKESFTRLCDKYGEHCRYCHKEGHWKSECPENPDRQQKMVELPFLDVTHPPRKRQRRR